MIDFLYNWISYMDSFLMVFFIIKYIFLKLCDIERKTFIRILMVVGIVDTVFSVLELFYEGISILGIIGVFIFLILKYERKHKIRSVFIVIPAIIMIFNLISIFIIIVYIFTGSFDLIMNDNSFLYINDIICWIGILVFAFRGKNFRKIYDEVIKNRTMDNYEKIILFIFLLFSSIITCAIFAIDAISISMSIKKLIMFCVMIISITLDLCILGMITQRNKKFYYQTLSDINEYYLKAQIDHFKNYQKQQRETRRIKHDMKNHMLLLNNLVQNGNMEEAKKYISNLVDNILEIDNEIHTGNEITDAIINGKSFEAKNKGIKISFNGILSNDIKVSAIDLCTIFSNALDNAIEHLANNNIEDKNIYVDVTSNNSIYMITFKNKISDINEDFISKKQDKLNHGFGIENMKKSIERYNGEMRYRVTEDHTLILEVMIFQ